MNLEQYIATYRRGTPALTLAEARIAGIGYPLQAGWFRKNQNKEVDSEAMRVAMRERHEVVAKRKGKESKREKKARLLAESLPKPSLVVSVSVEVAAPAAESEIHAYVNSPGFLTSFEWRQLRFKVLQKYGARCQCCGATPTTGAVINVDHIKPRRKFPELALDFDNLQVLCDACNHGKANQTVDFRAA